MVDHQESSNTAFSRQPDRDRPTLRHLLTLYSVLFVCLILLFFLPPSAVLGHDGEDGPVTAYQFIAIVTVFLAAFAGAFSTCFLLRRRGLLQDKDRFRTVVQVIGATILAVMVGLFISYRYERRGRFFDAHPGGQWTERRSGQRDRASAWQAGVVGGVVAGLIAGIGTTGMARVKGRHLSRD